MPPQAKQTDYFDTSALVKRYVDEIGSGWVRSRYSHSYRRIAMISIEQLELTAAFAGRLRGQSITQTEFDVARSAWTTDFARRYHVLAVTDLHLSTAISLVSKHRLRGYDALHLACAVLLNAVLIGQGLLPITFVAADNDLLSAAHSEGLATENPNDYV